MGEDEARALLRKILSPAEAQSLVQALAEPTPRPPVSSGLAGYFAAAPKASRNVETKVETKTETKPEIGYLKVCSNGQVGYLPIANLSKARQIDPNLKVLDEPEGERPG
jgi:hypothetical protein